jgi:hypothetical protein
MRKLRKVIPSGFAHPLKGMHNVNAAALFMFHDFHEYAEDEIFDPRRRRACPFVGWFPRFTVTTGLKSPSPATCSYLGDTAK